MHITPTFPRTTALAGLVLTAAAAWLLPPGRSGGHASAEPGPKSAAVECRWTDAAPKIDGDPSDPAWPGAATLDAGPGGGTVRLLWDREFLYFAAELSDAAAVRLRLRPAADRPGAHEFRVDSDGTAADRFLPSPDAAAATPWRRDGVFRIEAAVGRPAAGKRTVEGRIPWADLLRIGGRPAVGETWQAVVGDVAAEITFPGPKLPPGLPAYSPPTGCRVIGSPDPPLPARVRRAFPELKVDFPICIVREPGADRLIYAAEPRPYAPTTVYRIRDEPTASQPEVLFKSDGVVYDIAFHPKFAENGWFFVGSNAARRTRVTRHTMERAAPFRVVPGSEKLIIDWPSDGHNGGAVAFGRDGMLYITSGDGTSDSDRDLMGQGLDHLLAKVLRIDVDRPDPKTGKPYAAPADNPFVGVAGAAPETWAYGLRNPWRMTIDQQTGHVWVGNNGQDLWEQVYFVRRGDNYGWSVMEGSRPFYPGRKAGPTPFAKPALEHPHSEARSLTGGVVYYGARFPELRGAYVYGDYSTGRVWAAKHDGEKVLWHKEIADTRLRITGFGIDTRGELLICDHRGDGDGGFHTLEPTPPDEPAPPFPTKLSESGLFASVAGHVMKPGVIPYSVNSPLWSDGADKGRWIALPADGSPIDYTRWRGWKFPPGTVIVKSFALEAEQGRPETRRWIETRFLHNRGGEWYGYSYMWNDEQTDGTLVAAGGLDRTFEVRVPKSPEHPDGIRRQSWHYPSRTECMVCHSRAANFVLGLNESQMNREHDYGNGVRANQLAVLERSGVLRVDWAGEARNALRGALRAGGLDDKQANAELGRRADAREQRPAPASTLLPLPPERLARLPDPLDPKEPVEARARSYLQANCAHCHVEAGGGNAQMNLEFTAGAAKMKVIGVKPMHHTFDLPDARLIAPGRPESSVLLHRISHRGQGHMPPLATARVDPDAVRLITDWIRQVREPAAKE
jgi:glucose/arabinose dehydrogenase